MSTNVDGPLAQQLIVPVLCFQSTACTAPCAMLMHHPDHSGAQAARTASGRVCAPFQLRRHCRTACMPSSPTLLQQDQHSACMTPRAPTNMSKHTKYIKVDSSS